MYWLSFILHWFQSRRSGHNYQGSCEELSSKTKVGDALRSKPYLSSLRCSWSRERQFISSDFLISDDRYMFVYKNTSLAPVTSQLCSPCSIMLSYHAMFLCYSSNFVCVQLLIASSCMQVWPRMLISTPEQIWVSCTINYYSFSPGCEKRERRAPCKHSFRTTFAYALELI